MAVVSIRTKNHHLRSVDISNYLIILYYSYSITFFKILIDYRNYKGQLNVFIGGRQKKKKGRNKRPLISISAQWPKNNIEIFLHIKVY